MTSQTLRGCLLATLFGLQALVAGCSTAAVGAGAVGAMADAMAGNSLSKESRLRAEAQSSMQAFEDAQMPKYEESENSYLGVITQMQKEGLWFASLAHIDALESRWKASEHSRLLRADALRQTGNQEISAALYRQLLSGPYAARALHGLGLLAAAQGQFDLAVSHLRAAQKKAPTDALLLNDLGYALLQTAAGAEAGLPLKQAAQLQPKNVRIQSNLALYLAVFAKPEDALAWMNQSAMSKEQRIRVLERAKTLGMPDVPARIPANAQVLPDAAPKSPCTGCLIFERQLPATASAS